MKGRQTLVIEVVREVYVMVEYLAEACIKARRIRNTIVEYWRTDRVDCFKRCWHC